MNDSMTGLQWYSMVPWQRNLIHQMIQTKPTGQYKVTLVGTVHLKDLLSDSTYHSQIHY